MVKMIIGTIFIHLSISKENIYWMKRILLVCILFLTVIIVQAQPSSEKLIRQGVSLHDKGRYADAIECYKQALKINSSSMSATYEMSLSYLGLKEFNNAIKYSTIVINNDFQPLLMDAYIVKSTALAEMDKLDESIKLLNEALVRCGDEYLLHFNLGLSYFNKKDNKNAITHLQKAIEIDATHPSTFLMYAYALNDSGRWVNSLYSFHFFLLLEPNTKRSKEAFSEMYDILSMKLPNNSPSLLPEDGVDRKLLYESIQKLKPIAQDSLSQYKFFEEASKQVFFMLSQLQTDSRSGLLWDFFVPVYDEILSSNFFDVYCHYVSVAYFPQSLEWWNNNKDKVDNFIEWFETGQGQISEMDEESIDDSVNSDLENN